MIRVLVVDDHDLVRTCLARALDDQRGIRVVGQADSGEEALRKAELVSPDIVLMDVRMPGIGGLEATRLLVQQDEDLRVIALTVCAQEPMPSRFMLAGASGYLTKGAELAEVVRAIRMVHSGQHYIDLDTARAMAMRQFAVASAELMDVLTDRELQVMRMVVNCCTVQDIAEQLSLSEKTVHTYRYRVFDKLGISSNVEMALIAVRHGLVDANEVGPPPLAAARP